MTRIDAQDTRSAMRSANPVDARECAGAADDEHGQQALRRILSAEPIDAGWDAARAGSGPRRRPAVRRVSLGAGLTAAVVAAALLLIQGVGPQTALAATPAPLRYSLAGARTSSLDLSRLPAARPTLLRLAAAAAAQPAPRPPTAARVSYVHTQDWYLSVHANPGGAASVVTPQQTQVWTRTDGSYRQVEHRGQAEPGLTSDPDAVRRLTAGPATSDTTYPIGSYRGLDRVRNATTERAMDRALRADPEYRGPTNPGTWILIQEIQKVYAHQVVTPRMEASMWSVLADRTDVRLLGTVTDRAGRPGVAVGFSDDIALPENLILIIDPKTGHLLGAEQVLTKDAGKLKVRIPAVIEYHLYLEQGWSNTTTTLPRGR